RRIIQVDKGIVGPVEPRTKTVQIRQVGDYPATSESHRAVAKKLSSPLLMGPPICDELMAFVEHTFSEEEAGVVRRLHPLRGRTASDVARAEKRPVDEVQPLLEQLANRKRAIAADRPGQNRRYRLMPVMPGIFEMVLIGESPESLTDWHRRFAELVEILFETGYTLDYLDHPAPFVRFLPVGRALGSHPMALPCEQLEVVTDRYDTFGVGHCQCRTSMETMGQGCDKPLEVCTVMGEWAERGVDAGWLRRVSREELLDIKREAESHGMVTWIMNVESAKGQVSCSCCGCCCKAMRMVNEFNAPAAMAPPHFVPRFDTSACGYCTRCVRACPMGAITIDTSRETIQHQPERCIGCGQCALACDERKAIQMEPVPEFRLPYKSWFSFLLRHGPGALKTSWNAWRKR
ncbi:MAG: 4Fe-4S dicluster domain-containing protein, partial [Pirellulales bacterium]